MINALSINVEEYFHPSEVHTSPRPEEWGSLPARVPEEMPGLLEMLDRRQAKATFFVLGWVAEQHPAVIRRIAEAGHEIGCHSYAHQLVYNLSPKAFREDTLRAVR